MIGRIQRGHWMTGVLGVAGLAALSGCASFGGNVRGSFSCSAPDGICAPSSTIDDRALALISADPSDTAPSPAGSRQMPRAGGSHVAAIGRARPAVSDPGRTQERVLRIVFQPYIDERGRLHEASAVHAVVARGEWQQQALGQVAAAGPDIGAFAPQSLADAVDRFDPPLGDSVVKAEEALPDPAAIAAARARAADPVDKIRSDVRSRLAPRRKAASASPPAPAAASAPVAAAPSPSSASSAPVTGGSPQAQVQPPVTTNGRGAEAAARVKADPRYQQSAGEAARGARGAAAGAGAGAIPATGTAGTIKTANFPAAVTEDR